MLRVAITEKNFPGSGNAPARVVFRDLSLDVPAGEVCVVSGASGVGKSTLLSMIAGLDRDYRGSITGNEQPLGFMFQAPRLLPWASALRNVELVAGGHSERARHWLCAVGLEGSEHVYPERLSLGMAKRVNLARALAAQPALLLLDEPFASLDMSSARRICEVLRRESARRRVTILLVSHELGLAAEIADRMVKLEGAPARIVGDDADVRNSQLLPGRSAPIRPSAAAKV